MTNESRFSYIGVAFFFEKTIKTFVVFCKNIHYYIKIQFVVLFFQKPQKVLLLFSKGNKKATF